MLRILLFVSVLMLSASSFASTKWHAAGGSLSFSGSTQGIRFSGQLRLKSQGGWYNSGVYEGIALVNRNGVSERRRATATVNDGTLTLSIAGYAPVVVSHVRHSYPSGGNQWGGGSWGDYHPLHESSSSNDCPGLTMDHPHTSTGSMCM